MKTLVFVNRCLRRILEIYWPEIISNIELLEKCHESPIDRQIKRRKWGWIRSEGVLATYLSKPWIGIPKGKESVAVHGTTPRTVLAEATSIGMTWSEVKREAQDRSRWRTSVYALCPI
ncbi:unnamed protein product [Spodoptera exigua]|nr:unnamed protein product [Spodoptera exigua]